MTDRGSISPHAVWTAKPHGLSTLIGWGSWIYRRPGRIGPHPRIIDPSMDYNRTPSNRGREYLPPRLLAPMSHGRNPGRTYLWEINQSVKGEKTKKV